jgi:competence protein CoiA
MSHQFALDESDRVVHVNDVARGLRCGCRCVLCNQTLVAKRGRVREPYFSHHSGVWHHVDSSETLLHRYAKQIIDEVGSLRFPPCVCDEVLGLDRTGNLTRLVRIDAEKDLGEVIPDLLVHTARRCAIAIEVAYSSFCDEAKIARFANLGLPVLEIDLRAFTPERFNRAAVREAIINELSGKRWLWPVTSSDRCCLVEVLNISGRPVAMRTLPNGDFASTATRFHWDTVAMLRSLAKQHGGHYDPDLKSWIVRNPRAAVARKALRAMSG